ncbi:MAG: hypothetical protein V4760_02205 [Bdellovibrionota bacterium]
MAIAITCPQKVIGSIPPLPTKGIIEKTHAKAAPYEEIFEFAAFSAR